MENKRNQKTITGLKVGSSTTEIINNNLIPGSDNFYDIGSQGSRWQDAFLVRASITDSLGVGGGASIQGPTILGGDLSVAGQVEGGLEINGDTSVLGAFGVVGDATVSQNLTTTNLTVNGITTLGSQPEFSKFKASESLLSGGSLTRGGVTTREGLICYDGLSCNKSLHVAGHFETFKSASLLGKTKIREPVFKGKVVTDADAKILLMEEGDDTIIGPYLVNGVFKFYYRTNINSYFYIALGGIAIP